jgi:thiol-disulfide isomerase/thioredoxin
MRARPDNGAAPAPREDPYKYLSWKALPAPLPDLSVTGPDGAAVPLAGFKGKTVLLNLWASWCRPCIEEMPALARLQRDLGSADFAVVAVSIDHKPEEGRAWLKANTVDLPFYSDPEAKLFDALKAPGVPLSVFVDKDGQEVGRIGGAVPWDEAKARALIAKARGN